MSDRGDSRIRELERLARQGDDAAWSALQNELARRGEIVDYGLWEPLVADTWSRASWREDPTLMSPSGQAAYLHNGLTPYIVSPDYLKTRRETIQRLILVHTGKADRLILFALLVDKNQLFLFSRNITSNSLRKTSYCKGRRLQVIDMTGRIIDGGVVGAKWPTDETLGMVGGA